MFRNSFVLIIIASVLLFIYGLTNLFNDVEDNRCRMTYMFGQPQFTKVKVNNENSGSKYGLYYYSEGYQAKPLNDGLSGAPIIFVPGNGGSLKQVRSLASVALQKAKHSNIKLDYFTIDFNEELSGLFGGYLVRQKLFLEECIETIIDMYTSKTERPQVVLIGHSMGGELCKSVLTNAKITPYINSVIMISSPLDQPVLDLDENIDRFYANANANLSNIRAVEVLREDSDKCCTNCFDRRVNRNVDPAKISSMADNVLVISIGGGNRDLLVRAGLTATKFADIHAMTSSIPHVWLSCDHLSAVWCLQLMLVINRFLFAITEKPHHQAATFIEDKNKRLATAEFYFIGQKMSEKMKRSSMQIGKAKQYEKWHENKHRISSKRYLKGVKDSNYEFWDLRRFDNYEQFYIELFNYDKDNWLFGCYSDISPQQKACEKVINLSKYITIIPAGVSTRAKAELDLFIFRQKFKDLHYLVVKMPITDKMIQLNVDVFNTSARLFVNKAPNILDFKTKSVVNETLQGTIKYKLKFSGMLGTFHSVQLNIEPVACYEEHSIVTVKVCTPWAPGFERFTILSKQFAKREVFVYSNVEQPRSFNTLEVPLEVDVFLDPVCRYKISYKLNMANSMARLIKEFFSWLPAHLVCVFIFSFKNNFAKFLEKTSLRTLRPFTAFFQYRSLFLISGSRFIKKLVMRHHSMPTEAEGSFIVFVIIHSAAIAASILLSMCLWGIILFNSNFITKVLYRFFKISVHTPSVLHTIMGYLPLSLGVLGIAIALSTSSALALIFATVFYFVTISGAFRDHLEEYVWKKAATLIKETIQTSYQTPAQAQQSRGLLQQREDSNDTTTPAANSEDEDCTGLEHFSYHFAMFFLLLIMTGLHIPSSIVWYKEKGTFSDPTDPTFMASIITLTCLSILLQLKAPNKISGSVFVKYILYIAAAACVVFCHDKIFYLNFIIASVFSTLTIYEIIGFILRMCQCSSVQN